MHGAAPLVAVLEAPVAMRAARDDGAPEDVDADRVRAAEAEERRVARPLARRRIEDLARLERAGREALRLLACALVGAARDEDAAVREQEGGRPRPGVAH